jgi:hypothetical protein
MEHIEPQRTLSWQRKSRAGAKVVHEFPFSILCKGENLRTFQTLSRL